MTSPSYELKHAKSGLISLFSSGEVSEAFQENYSEIVDHYFRRSVQESDTGQRLFRDKKPFALVAVGGYGRRELCLHSDIDVLILFDSKVPSSAKKMAEDVFYPLWNLGLDLGHGIRSVKDCVGLAAENFEALTSLMDARFLCGESPLYLSLMERVEKKVLPKKGPALGRWLEEQNRMRMNVFGDASSLLEPNLKEGIGGLRDYHHLLWLAKAFFRVRTPKDLEYSGILSHKEYADLESHLRFIHLVRNHLHRESERKNDRLTVDHQVRIAKTLGFKDQDGLLAVEQFLGQLHASMASIKSLHRSFVFTHFPGSRRNGTGSAAPESVNAPFHEDQGELQFPSAVAILGDPLLLLEIFVEGVKAGRSLSLESKRLVREFLYLVDDPFRTSPRAARGFLSLLNAPNAFDALDQMLETGFLPAFVPEFEPVLDRVQFDHYHLFPVGRHVLETVRCLKSLRQEKDILLTDIFLDLPDPETLFLAALFHDIGKTGKDHAAKGAALVRKILKRLGYDPRKTEDACFLVRHHLLLPETATRRDLNDEKIVVQCAGEVGTIERLKMLYLLSWADGKATGPRAWNDWIANLTLELFFKVLHILERGELATPDASKRMRQSVQQVRRQIGDRVAEADREAVFELMSPNYLIETSPQAIARHMALYANLREAEAKGVESVFCLEAKAEPASGTFEVTFIARDRAGLFSDVAGVMALNNLNILSAHIYTWRDGTAVDIFTVTPPLDPIRTGEFWERVKADLAQTFQERLSLSDRLEQKERPTLLSRKKILTGQTRVRVDNQSSDFFTLIEVFTDDRVGLLYRITHTLFTLGIDIRVAKIATKADQVADVFYVLDLEGQKVLEPAGAEKIREALVRELSGP
ncbi:MAG: [protein-PII] uridylyltransferase [Desulfobacterota bacterium]|jgi:[protein-PII] uridylyltransferase|nr:[protein-PII] uridylyltransferase [Thermodesulfobacteriota bacterium]